MNPTALTSSHYVATPSADFAAMIDALYRFAAGQDLRDRLLFESAFSADATLDFTAPAKRLGATIPIFQGRREIADIIMSTTSKLDTTHTVSNPRVTAYEEEHAGLFAMIEAQHLPSGDHSRHLLLKNLLTIRLSRESEYWMIDHMTFNNVWLSGDPSVLFAR